MNNEAMAVLQNYKNRLLVRWNTALQEQFKKLLPTLFGGVLKNRDASSTHVMKPVSYSVFPDGTRYFWQEETEAMIVYEEKPKVRTIEMVSGYEREILEKARLAFPYIVYIATYEIRDSWFPKEHPDSVRQVTDQVT